MNRCAFTLAALAVAALVAACTGSNDEPPASSPGSTAEATATLPAPTSTATPQPLPASGAALFDLRNGTRVVIPSAPQARVEFGLGDAVEVSESSSMKRYDFSGREVGQPVVNMHVFTCEVANGAATIQGKLYPDVPSCGVVSTDVGANWMLYQVPGPSVPAPRGGTLPTWDQWALNRQTDERRLLQAGLVHCGGCDGRFGPAWSPNARFVYFSEFVSGGRVFLSDLEAGTTRLLFQGSVEVSAQPSWAGKDALLYRSTSGAVTLEDLGAGTRRELTALSWRACFDPGGRYVYAPSATAERSYGVYSLADQRIVATLPGTTETNGNGYSVSCPEDAPIQSTDTSYVMVLSGGSTCPGVAVYEGALQKACVDLPVTIPSPKDNLRVDARTALSGLGGQVAVARLTAVGAPPPCTPGQPPCNPATIEALYRANPGSNPFRAMHTYEVLVVDAATGTVRTLATGLVSSSPPQLTWNDGGTHLLVRWPFETFSGL
jgi:hypothetical protein